MTATISSFPRTICWKEAASHLEQMLSAVVEESSLKLDVDARDLRKQMLLHLPRLEADRLFDRDMLRHEAVRLGERLSSLQEGYREWSGRPLIPALEKSKIEVRPCDPTIAQEIYRRFHYIGSSRSALIHIGLFDPLFPDIPFALAALSEMDVVELKKLLPRDRGGDTLVLSRAFAFSWAPRNSISFLLGAVHAWVRENAAGVRDLITYLNPNLGFAGSSYAAANWRPLLETPAQYLYLNDNYISYRTYLALEEGARSGVTRSLYQLEPLRIYAYSVRSKGHGRI
jgi:hypothetical protein